MGIPMLKIRRTPDRLIFNMGILILVRRHLYIETAPRVPFQYEDHLSNYSDFHYNNKTIMRPSWWVRARRVQLQCVSNGVMSFLHRTIDLIFIMGIPIQIRHLYTEMAPRVWFQFLIGHLVSRSPTVLLAWNWVSECSHYFLKFCRLLISSAAKMPVKFKKFQRWKTAFETLHDLEISYHIRYWNWPMIEIQRCPLH